MEEKEIIGHVLAGKHQYFEHLVARYKDLVFSVISRFVPYDRVDDLAQETFFTVFDKLSQYKPEKPFINWVYTIALNKARIYCRKQKVRKNIKAVFISGADEENYFFQQKSSDKSEDNELKRIVRDKIRRLPFKYSQVITLYYDDNLKIEQIGEILNEKPATVKTWLNRARKKLSENRELKKIFETLQDENESID